MNTLFPDAGEELADVCRRIAALLPDLPLVERVSALNRIVAAAHAAGPFAAHPVGCPQWVPNETVRANDYNPNSVAPPEMKLLELSVTADGFTQPIVTFLEKATDDRRETVDGFHRGRVGKECDAVRASVHGYLPVVTIRSDRGDRKDRIAATIRHNRARGKHGVEAMSGIVLELVRRNWADDKIAKELGMDADEVLRLKQITGLAELFRDRDFSEAWEADDGR